MEAWEALEEPWRACLELAWEAYLAGTVPVGAVVVDADGAIVARGRNRIFEPHDGGIAGTRLAHAEVNALAQLAATRRYPDHTLYSALEPCLLCLGAATLSRVGAIRYAAADVYGGACAAGIDTDDFRRAAIRVDGPLGGWQGRLAAALQAAFWSTRPTAAAQAIVDSFGVEAAAAGARIAALDGGADPALERALPALLQLL